MDYLKPLFGDGALTYDQLAEKLKDDKDVKLANLASGQYVDKSKLDAKVTELSTANRTIQQLRDTVKKFDGVDVEKLKSDLAAADQKYAADTAQIRLDAALEVALLSGKAKNTKAVKALLDASAVKLDGDKLLGLDDQLTKIKTDAPYLFEDEPAKPTVTSANPHNPTPPSATDGGKTVSERIANKTAGLFATGE